jgi:hypothetical protein
LALAECLWEFCQMPSTQHRGCSANQQIFGERPLRETSLGLNGCCFVWCCGIHMLCTKEPSLRPQVPEMALCYPEIDNSLALGAIWRCLYDGVLHSVAMFTLFCFQIRCRALAECPLNVLWKPRRARGLNVCDLRFVWKAPNEYSPNVWRVPNIWCAPS